MLNSTKEKVWPTTIESNLRSMHQSKTVVNKTQGEPQIDKSYKAKNSSEGKKTTVGMTQVWVGRSTPNLWGTNLPSFEEPGPIGWLSKADTILRSMIRWLESECKSRSSMRKEQQSIGAGGLKNEYQIWIRKDLHARKPIASPWYSRGQSTTIEVLYIGQYENVYELPFIILQNNNKSHWQK